MHTVNARINNISETLSTCLMVLLTAIAASSLIFYADPKGTLDIKTFKVTKLDFKGVNALTQVLLGSIHILLGYAILSSIKDA